VDDDRLAFVAHRQDLDGALDHDEEVDAPVAAPEDIGALLQILRAAEGRHALLHLVAELREGLLAAVIRIGRIQLDAGRLLCHERPSYATFGRHSKAGS
jgi:hypothetical protein